MFSSSSYEGWDNPFRPEGQISHEAEELLRLWRAGKLKNPDGTPDTEEPDAATLTQRALEQEKQEKEQKNKTNGHSPANGSSGTTKSAVVEVRRENAPLLSQPGKPQHVTLGSSGGEDKEPKKKKGCCSIM